MNIFNQELTVKNLTCAISDHPQGYSCNWHRIKDTLICVQKGTLEIRCGNQVISVAKGESILIPAGLVGVTYFTEKENLAFLFLFSADSENLGKELLFFKRSHSAESIVNDMLCAYTDGEININYYLSGFYMLLYHFQESREIAPKFVRIHELMLDIERNYFLNLSLADYAKSVAMSESNLRLLFKQYTGKSVIEYRNAVRLRRAEEFILGGMTVSEASEKVGFSSPSYYCRLKKQF